MFLSFKMILSFFAVLCTASPLWAQSQARIEGILINADDVDRNQETGIIVLEGNVRAIFKTQSLQAERAVLNLKTKEVDATGNVSLITQQATIVGDRVILNYETQLGIIYNGYVQAGPALFEGTIIHKTGENDYTAEKADYTACTTCPAAWSFSGKSITAELGGYAYIKNSFFRVSGVPILWFPYMVVPLKSTRQTGLLTPSIETSPKGGLAVSESYFWAISRSQDATFTAKNYQKRGFKSLLNYRYVLSESSHGELDAAHIADRRFSKEDRFNKFRGPDRQNTITDRWFVKYNHYYILPEDFISRARLNFVSDLQYPNDFPKESTNHGDPALENRMSLSKNTDTIHWSVDSSYYVNLLQSNPQASNDMSVHRLPEIKVATSELKILDTDILFKFDMDYTNFARNGPSFDDMEVVSQKKFIANDCDLAEYDDKLNPSTGRICKREFDNAFDPNKDLIRTGQRFDFGPSISRPFKLGPYFDFVPRLSYRETHYHFNLDKDDSLVRRYVRTELSTSTTFSRVYGDSASPIATRYKHEIQPKITATSLPWVEYPEHPFFGNQNTIPEFSRSPIGDADVSSINGLQFDYEDRIYDRNIVNFGITNNLTERTWNGGKVDYKRILSWSVSQNYDAYQASRNPKQAWSDINSLLQVYLANFEVYTLINYFPRQEVSNISSRVRVKDERSNFLEVGLTQTYTSIIPEKKYVDHNIRTEDFVFNAGLRSHYLDLIGQLVYDANWKNSATRDRFKSWAYIAILRPPGECFGFTFSQTQKTDGDQVSGITFDFLFDGVNRTALTQDMLQNTGT